MSTAVEEAKKLLKTIPRSATWDEIMHEFNIKQKFNTALIGEKEGRVMSSAEVKKRLLKR
jgi:hypothetical protein